MIKDIVTSPHHRQHLPLSVGWLEGWFASTGHDDFRWTIYLHQFGSFVLFCGCRCFVFWEVRDRVIFGHGKPRLGGEQCSLNIRPNLAKINMAWSRYIPHKERTYFCIGLDDAGNRPGPGGGTHPLKKN